MSRKCQHNFQVRVRSKVPSGLNFKNMWSPLKGPDGFVWQWHSCLITAWWIYLSVAKIKKAAWCIKVYMLNFLYIILSTNKLILVFVFFRTDFHYLWPAFSLKSIFHFVANFLCLEELSICFIVIVSAVYVEMFAILQERIVHGSASRTLLPSTKWNWRLPTSSRLSMMPHLTSSPSSLAVVAESPASTPDSHFQCGSLFTAFTETFLVEDYKFYFWLWLIF